MNLYFEVMFSLALQAVVSKAALGSAKEHTGGYATMNENKTIRPSLTNMVVSNFPPLFVAFQCKYIFPVTIHLHLNASL